MNEIKQESKKKDYLFEVFEHVSNDELENLAKAGYGAEQQELSYRYLNKNDYALYVEALVYMQSCMQNESFNTKLEVQILYARVLMRCFLNQHKINAEELLIKGLDDIDYKAEKQIKDKSHIVSFDQIVALCSMLAENNLFNPSMCLDFVDLLHQVCKKQKNISYSINFVKDAYLNYLAKKMDEKNKKIKHTWSLRRFNKIVRLINKLNNKYVIPRNVREDIYLSLLSRRSSLLLNWQIAKLYMQDDNNVKSKVLGIHYYIQAGISVRGNTEPKDFVEFREKSFSLGDSDFCYYLTIASIIAYKQDYFDNEIRSILRSHINGVLKIKGIKEYYGLPSNYTEILEDYSATDKDAKFHDENATKIFTQLLRKDINNTMYIFRVLIEEDFMPQRTLKFFTTILKQKYLQSKLDYLEISRCKFLYNAMVKSDKYDNYAEIVNVVLNIKDAACDKSFVGFLNHLLSSLVIGSNDINNLELGYKLYTKYKSVITLGESFKEKSFDVILDNKINLYNRSKHILINKLCNEAIDKLKNFSNKLNKQAHKSVKEFKDIKKELTDIFDDRGLLQEVSNIQTYLTDIIGKKTKWKKELSVVVSKEQVKIERAKEAFCLLKPKEKPKEDLNVNNEIIL